VPRLVTDKDREVFVSLEQTPLVLSDVRRGLPQLERDIRRKWPVQAVVIENRLPLRRNPYLPGTKAIIETACLGILVRFTLSAAQAVGAKVGDVMGREIAKHVKRWIGRFGKLGAKHSAPARRRAPRKGKR
jgi:hypothetical protein